MSQKNNNSAIAGIADQLRATPDRRHRFAITEGDWHFNYALTPLTEARRAALLDELSSIGLAGQVGNLFDGEIVNPSENQPARHMMLRASRPEAQVLDQRNRFLALAERLHASETVTDLLHIGIGGSDLGPRLVAEALEPNVPGPRVHWLSTMDGRRFQRLTRELDPDRTAVVIASKSFSTEETLTQARAARDWLGDRFSRCAWASTAQSAKAVEFGISSDQVLDFPTWTGGRFSLWSSVGVSAAARIGREAFEGLLAGARAADAALENQPDQQRLSVMVALLMHYLRRDLDLPTLGFVSYEPRLALLADYLQQLVMESLGKRVDLHDQAVDAPTAPLIFGGRGTDLQHSIFQALHQGPDSHPLILVGTLDDDHAYPDWHRAQLAHMFAQAQAFAYGRPDAPPHQQLPGNRPVGLLMSERLTPQALGFLLASFEHAVFVLSALWRINPFDQWGVEEGKRLAKGLRARLDEGRPRLQELGDLLIPK